MTLPVPGSSSPLAQSSAPVVALVLPVGMTLGGVETWSVQMCRHLQQAGERVQLLVHATPPDKQPIALPADLPVHQYRRARVWSSRQHRRALAEILPAVVVPNGSVQTLAACAQLSRQPQGEAPAGAALRIIGVAHAFEEYYFAMLAYYEPLVHRFIAVSEECAQELRRRLPPHRAADVLVRGCPVSVPSTLARTYAMAADEPLRLLYAGRIEQKQKRVFDLLSLAEELSRRNVRFQLDIVGEGLDKAALCRRHAALPPEVRQRVAICAGVGPEQIGQLLGEHDVSVMTSAYEGLSVFMLESLAHGCVPVVTDVSGTRAVIRDGENGLRLPVGDVAAMARGIGELAADRGRLERMGRAGHRTVAEAYALGDYVQWFQQLVWQVWREPPRVWPADKPTFSPRLRLAKTARAAVARVPGLLRMVRAILAATRRPGDGMPR